MNKAKLQKIGLWVLQIFLALTFGPVGFSKLSDHGSWPSQFRQWGYPEHFYLAVGIAELLGGMALLLPRTAGCGAMLLMVVMGGATVHHLRRHEVNASLSVIILFALLTIVAYARRPAFFRRQ